MENMKIRGYLFITNIYTSCLMICIFFVLSFSFRLSRERMGDMATKKFFEIVVIFLKFTHTMPPVA